MKIYSLFIPILALLSTTVSAAPLKVVATLSTFTDLVEQIGGEHVDVYTIAPPNFNPHFIEPRPSDVLRAKKADLFVHSGLDLEVWSDPLIVAAANPKIRPGNDGHLKLSTGVHLLEIPRANTSRAQGDIHLHGNPHYWHSPDNVAQMIKNIHKKLAQLDPEHESTFTQNAQTFQKKLQDKTAEWNRQLKPYEGVEFIGYHNQWPYLMAFTKASMKKFLEPKPGISPGPKQLNALTLYAKKNKVAGVIHTSYYSVRPSKTLAKRIDVPLIILAQNVKEQKQASDYFALMDYNIQQIITALKGR